MDKLLFVKLTNLYFYINFNHLEHHITKLRPYFTGDKHISPNIAVYASFTKLKCLFGGENLII